MSDQAVTASVPGGSSSGAPPPPPSGGTGIGAGGGAGSPTAGAVGGAVFDEWRMEFAWNTHAYINEYIRFADTKAAAAILFCSGLIAGLYTAGAHHLFSRSTPGHWGFLGFVAFLAFAFLAVGVVAAGWATLPRLWSSQPSRGYVFWDRILVHGTPAAFVNDVTSRSGGELLDHVSHHLFDLSAVCRSKYKCVKVSLWTAGIGALIGGFVVLQMPVASVAPAADAGGKTAQVVLAPTGSVPHVSDTLTLTDTPPVSLVREAQAMPTAMHSTNRSDKAIDVKTRNSGN